MSMSSGRERGGCLSLYLLLAIFGAVFGLIAATGAGAVNAALVAQTGESAFPVWYIPALIVNIVITLIAVYGIFSWKKWGVYLLVVTWVLSIGINVASGSGIGNSAVTLVVEALLLAYVLRNKWALFE